MFPTFIYTKLPYLYMYSAGGVDRVAVSFHINEIIKKIPVRKLYLEAVRVSL